MAADTTPFAGELIWPVSIYRMDVVKDVLGTPKQTPVLVCNTRAKAVSNSGAESADTKVEHQTRAVYIIRKRNAAVLLSNQKLQLVDGAVTYNIEHVAKLMRTHFILKCTANE